MSRAKSTPPRYVFGVDDMAGVFGIDRRTVQRLVTRGMPQISRGKYDVRECVQWWTADIKGGTANAGKNDRDLLAQAQREKVILEVAEMRRQLVATDLVGRVLNQIATLVSGQLDSLGPRLAGELADSDDPAWIQGRLFAEARALRAAIAQSIREFGSSVRETELEAEDEEAVDDAV